MQLVLIILLILLCVGTFPAWPHAASWGPYPSGGFGLLLVVLLVLVLLGRL